MDNEDRSLLMPINKTQLLAIAVALGAGVGLALFTQRPPKRLSIMNDSGGATALDQPRAHSASDRTGRRKNGVRPPSLVAGVAPPSSDQAIPGSSGYNPRAFLPALGPAGVFRHEARDPEWAPQVEKHLQGRLKEDLLKILHGDLDSVSVECRVSTCLVTVPDTVDFRSAFELIRFLYPPGAAQQKSGDRGIYLVYQGGVFDRLGDPADTVAKIEQRRTSQLQAVARISQTPDGPLSDLFALIPKDRFPQP
jgi:hypothetical protein